MCGWIRPRSPERRQAVASASTACCARSSSRVERLGDHAELALRGARPFGFGAIPVKLDAVAVGVAKIECLADAVVGGAFEWNVAADKAAEGVGELGARRIHDGEVIEAGGAGRGRGAAMALPGVETDVVMIATRGEEGGGVADSLRDFKAENVAIEGKCAIEVSDLEVDVAYSGLWVDGGHTSRISAQREMMQWPRYLRALWFVAFVFGAEDLSGRLELMINLKDIPARQPPPHSLCDGREPRRHTRFFQ
jgi:hypothetical protein